MGSYVLLGMSTGMRTLTSMAVLCWFAWLQLVPQHGWAFWTGNLVSVVVFTAMALGEYIGDTLPQTPNRTAWYPLAARLGFGCLIGALSANGMGEPVAGGVIFSLAGVLIGAFGGLRLRLWVSRLLGRDLPAALLESASALALSVFAMYLIYRQLVSDATYHAALTGLRIL